MSYFLTVLGLLCFIEGIPYLAFPEQLRHWLEQVSQMPEKHLRALGGILMVAGLVLVYLGRHHGG